MDAERAIQPFTSADGRWVLCYNGEVFNYRVLQAELASLGHRLRTDSDTEVVLEAFLEWGAGAVQPAARRVRVPPWPTPRPTVSTWPATRWVKPLYWSRQGGCLHVASEIKALTGVGAPVSEVPPGIMAGPRAAPLRTALPRPRRPDAGAGPALRPYVDLLRLGDDQPPIEDPDEAAKLVRAALETASGCGWTPA